MALSLPPSLPAPLTPRLPSKDSPSMIEIESKISKTGSRCLKAVSAISRATVAGAASAAAAEALGAAAVHCGLEQTRIET